MAEALSRKIRILPIILEDCDWQNHQLSDIQALPDQGKPINEWQPESKGWQNVVAGLRNVVDKIRAQASDIAQEETLSEWIFQQGNFLMMIGQIDKAIEAYSHVTEINPRYVATYNNRGIAYLGKGMYDQAIADCNKILELNPELAIAYNKRGNAYFDKGDYDQAIADYSKAIELKPDYDQYYYNRGNAYGRKRTYNRALADYKKAIRLNPDSAEVYHERGNMYFIKGAVDRAIADYNKAIKDYNKAIELKPDSAITYYNRGMCWLHLQNWQGARSDLANAKNRGMNIIAAFRNGYKNVGTFEQQYSIKLPEDIAAMLTQG
ncbi:MAG: tetratricopeptide repeat protein [Gemmatimonadetes bacterium]|nr:tetratricopeptide repeat protein [Gemmatimonadota bacterium]